MTKWFLIAYTTITILVSVLILIDFEKCYNLEWPNGGIQIVTLGVIVMSSVIWPITLPGIIATYDSNEGHICLP